MEEIGRLNPLLTLTVTSTKKKAVIDQLARVSLQRIYCVDFTGLMGSHGGSNLSDKALRALVPALGRVRNLALSCRGYRNECFSPDALRALGDGLEGIEFLLLDHYQAGEGTYEDHARPRIAPIDDYAEAIASSPGFRSLKVLFLRGADPGRLRELPDLVTIETSTSGGIDAPRNARQLEKLKTATATAA